MPPEHLLPPRASTCSEGLPRSTGLLLPLGARGTADVHQGSGLRWTAAAGPRPRGGPAGPRSASGASRGFHTNKQQKGGGGSCDENSKGHFSLILFPHLFKLVSLPRFTGFEIKAWKQRALEICEGGRARGRGGRTPGGGDTAGRCRGPGRWLLSSRCSPGSCGLAARLCP